mmetsp:Transcript_18150/g.32499  ORF Transcript_18150/g.32499 Transcript_18150/m.32499 type:complete len:626 (-) Transcript_18150:869-2746(-)
MARARINLYVQLLSFRNIDLQMQGIYRVLFSTSEDATIESFEDLGSSSRFPPDATEHSYLTKGLEVQFLDEVIEVKEIICIQYEIDFDELAKPQTFTATLAYYGLDGQISKELQTVHLEVQGLERGVFEHTVISFDGYHSCCLVGNFFSSLTSIKVPRAPAFAATLFLDSRGNLKRLVGAAEAKVTFRKYTAVLKNLHNCLYQFLYNLTRNSTSLNDLPEQMNSIEEKELNMHDPVLIAEEMISEFMVWTSRLSSLKNYMLEAMRIVPTLLDKLLTRQSNARLHDEIVKKLFSQRINSETHVSLRAPENRSELRLRFAKSLRKVWEHTPHYGVRTTGIISHTNLFFEESYNKSRSFIGMSLERTTTAADWHLVVLVHGYQGTSVDMRCVKAALLGAFPHLTILSAETLGEISDYDIFEQGSQLATEVRNFMSLQATQPSKISFIGHSMGGLVIRAALLRLEEYSSKMNVLCTLNSPHLGFLMKPSALIGTGLWLFKVLKNTLSLDQLTMKDRIHKNEKALYRLSVSPGLEWFEHVILVGSHQDSYTPVESSLVEVPQSAAVRHPDLDVIAKNMLTRMKSLSRIDANYKMKKRGFVDTLIGRAAHVECIDNEAVVRMIALRFYYLW